MSDATFGLADELRSSRENVKGVVSMTDTVLALGKQIAPLQSNLQMKIGLIHRNP